MAADTCYDSDVVLWRDQRSVSDARLAIKMNETFGEILKRQSRIHAHTATVPSRRQKIQ